MRIKSDHGMEEVCGAEYVGANENFAPLLTEESGQKSRFVPLPSTMARECNPEPFCQSRDFGIEFA